MPDIRLEWSGEGAPYGDVALAAADLETDDGLETAVLVSLFTDRRALDSDELPAGAEDRRGWWGDVAATVEGDQVGSRLWLLSREKRTADVLNRAREYAREALRWLLDDEVATRVEVDADYINTDWLALRVEITRPGEPVYRGRYEYNWRAQLGA
ncbi:phage GP46 family protein [Salinicola avicenniae]|uniref:phage GP46 family protein n=1 Tax=Salinicola avicenniae TaxID=2916836 RepID=UPI0020749FCD|nr:MULTISPECIES: phage GP46 family protein [unclassified Salinicola]